MKDNWLDPEIIEPSGDIEFFIYKGYKGTECLHAPYLKSKKGNWFAFSKDDNYPCPMYAYRKF